MTSEDYGYLRELADQFIHDTCGKDSHRRNEYIDLLADFLDYAESIERTSEPAEREILYHRKRF